MGALIKRFLFATFILCFGLVDGFAQAPEVKSLSDEVDRLLKVSSGDKIELKVGEKLGVYSDTEDVVDRYASLYEGAYLEAAFVYFSDGKGNSNPNSKYVSIDNRDPKSDFNILNGIKPTSGYIDMMIYYVITYFDKRGRTYVDSNEYYFKVKVVGADGDEGVALQKLSLPSKVSVGKGLHYLLTPSVKPEGADPAFTWTTSDSQIVHIVPDSDVYIYGRKEGVATVTVTADNGMQASTEVHVLPEPEIIKDFDLVGDFWYMTKELTKALKRL